MGVTWSIRSSIPNLTLLGLSSTDVQHAWMIGYNHSLYPAADKIFASVDGGVTWQEQQPQLSGTPIPSPCTSPKVSFDHIQFADSKNGWLMGNILCFGPNGYYVLGADLAWTTTDGGTTWTAHNTGLTSSRMTFRRMSVIDAQHMRLLYVSSSSNQEMLLTSDDGGATFNNSVVDPRAQDISFIDAAHGYLMAQAYPGGGYLLVTSDGGRTWSPIGNPAPSQIAVPANLAPGRANYYWVNVQDANHWWLSGFAGGDYVFGGLIVATSDGGITWTVKLMGDGSTPP